MTLLKGYQHDVFVSYAHLDNDAADGADIGWVDHLIRRVELELRQRLGGREVSFWVDRELAGNKLLTPTLIETVTKSATLLLVMSPGYLRSEWCQRERNTFLQQVKNRLGSGRVFVVQARRVDQQDVPAELRELLGYRFWTEDPETNADRRLGFPDKAEAAYIKAIVRLARDLKEQLEMMNGKAQSAEPSAQAPSMRIYLARSTEDLEEKEDEVRAFLEQANQRVLPDRRYPLRDCEGLQEALRTDLQSCQIFVQLLSGSRGRELDCMPGKRYPGVQADMARSLGITALQWRDRNTDVASIRDTAHRSLLEGARACGIEEFKRALLEEATRPPSPTPPSPPTSVVVFVNADGPDRRLAEHIGQELASHGVECYWPLASGSPEEVRKDLEENLKNCDGLLLIYGATQVDWVRYQLLQRRKLLAARTKPLAALAIVEGPPPETKVDLGGAVPQLMTLNCRAGIDRTVLADFVRTLQH